MKRREKDTLFNECDGLRVDLVLIETWPDGTGEGSHKGRGVLRVQTGEDTGT